MSNTAIVTGYSAGLGREFTATLLREGWSVVGVSRNTEDEQLDQQYPGKLTVVHGPVDEQETVDAAFAAATSSGDFRLLINCAGVGVFGEIGSYSANDVHAVLTGNLAGLMLFSDKAVNHLREGGGDIVNVMSTAGKKLRAAETMYVASKWGAKGYTRGLRDAVKSLKLPIRVFEVYPCGMNTRFWESAIRPVATRDSFPEPGAIAEQVIAEVLTRRPVYCQEFTFERS